jgi:GntR family transcriptional regulator
LPAERCLIPFREAAHIDVEVAGECLTPSRGEAQCAGRVARGDPVVEAEAPEERGAERTGEMVAALGPVKTRARGAGVLPAGSRCRCLTIAGAGARRGERDPIGREVQCAVGLRPVIERRRDRSGDVVVAVRAKRRSKPTFGARDATVAGANAIMLSSKAATLGFASQTPKHTEYDANVSSISSVVVINPSSPIPLHEQVAAAVRRAIAEGEAGPGDRLPPAKDLAAVLGVNANTVFRGLRTLRDEGLLEFRRGRGVTVSGDGPRRSVLVEKARELVALAQELGYHGDELASIIDQVSASPS